MFGAPPAANKAQLVIIMSGDYRSKKEVAYLLVPAVGRKVVDLGGNLEKGRSYFRYLFTRLFHSLVCTPSVTLRTNYFSPDI